MSFKHLKTKYNRKQISQFALTVDNQEKSKNFNPILKKVNQSLCNCGKKSHSGNVLGVVSVKQNSKSRHMSGLMSCGNNASCPVCANKLSAIRGNELSELMEAGRKNNRSYIMVVNTISHKPGEALEITLNQVLDMSKHIFNQREFKNFKKLTKLRFVHSGLENMVSVKNGLIDWHPHKNFLLDFDISIESVLQILSLSNKEELQIYISKMFTRLGQGFLDKNYIDKTLLKPFFQEITSKDSAKRIVVKGGCSATCDFDNKYITKWGLEAELTASVHKSGKNRDSMHPFALLDLIDEKNIDIPKEEKYKYIKAFQEFVLASRGKSWFRFARGSVEYYNKNYSTEIRNKKDEQAIAEAEAEGEEILTLNKEEWKSFKATPKKIGFALSRDTKKDVINYIFEEIEKNRIKDFTDG